MTADYGPHWRQNLKLCHVRWRFEREKEKEREIPRAHIVCGTAFLPSHIQRNKLKPQNFSCRHLKSLRSWTGGNNFTNYARVISTRRKTKQKHPKRRKRNVLHSFAAHIESGGGAVCVQQWSGNFLRCAKQKAKLSLFRFLVFVSWCGSSPADTHATFASPVSIASHREPSRTTK